MKRFMTVAAAVIALAASPAFLVATTTPGSAQGWRAMDEDMSDSREALADRLRTRRDLRDLLEDRLQLRRDLVRDFLEDRTRSRGLRDVDDDDRDGLRGRLRERLAESRRGREREGCYFLTRSLRAEDGDLLVIIRRRVCRDGDAE